MLIEFVPPDVEFLTLEQCARITQKSVEEILCLVRAGRLPAIDLGLGLERDWRIIRGAILKAHRAELPPAATLQNGTPEQPIKRKRGRPSRLADLAQRRAQIANNNGSRDPVRVDPGANGGSK